MLFNFFIISSISTNYLLFKYKIFNVDVGWSGEQINTYREQTQRTYEKNMKACKLMFDEDKCELMNGYLKNTVFVQSSSYGNDYAHHISEDTDFIFINIYSKNAATPIRFSFLKNVSVNVFVKAASMDSPLLEDQFSVIQENSQKMYKKIMKNFYNIDVPMDNFSAQNNKKLLPKDIKKEVQVYGSDFSKIPILYFESCVVTFKISSDLNSLILIDSSFFYNSFDVTVDYLYAPLIFYSSNLFKITVKKQATAIITDKGTPDASSNFYEFEYYREGIIIKYSDNPYESGNSLGTQMHFDIAEQIGIIARGLNFNFSCYNNNPKCATYKTNLTIADDFSIPTVNILEEEGKEKEKIKINIKSQEFNSNSFIVNYDRNKYQIERTDELNDINITEEDKYEYKPISFTDISTSNTIDDNEQNEDPKDNPTKKQSNTGWIVGIVICIVIIVALVIVIVVLVIRSKNNQKSSREKEGDLSLI